MKKIRQKRMNCVRKEQQEGVCELAREQQREDTHRGGKKRKRLLNERLVMEREREMCGVKSVMIE